MLRLQLDLQAMACKEFLLFGCETDEEIFGLDTEVSIAAHPQRTVLWLLRWPRDQALLLPRIPMCRFLHAGHRAARARARDRARRCCDRRRGGGSGGPLLLRRPPVTPLCRRPNSHAMTIVIAFIA